MSSLDEQIAKLKNCEYLKESEVKSLCAKAREILESTTLRLLGVAALMKTAMVRTKGKRAMSKLVLTAEQFSLLVRVAPRIAKVFRKR